MMNKLQTKFKKMQNKKGFTLIELIVVIVIIGILAAIIIPRLGGFSDRAEESACEATRRTVETAAAVYYADNQAYPASLTALLDAYTGDAALFAETPACPADGTYTIGTDGSVTCSVHPEETTTTTTTP